MTEVDVVEPFECPFVVPGSVPFCQQSEMLNQMILCPDKSLVKGDYLIDDDNRHGQTEFEGEHIHFGTEQFPDWDSVCEYLVS